MHGERSRDKRVAVTIGFSLMVEELPSAISLRKREER
jgi:hypothetical protein